MGKCKFGFLLPNRLPVIESGVNRSVAAMTQDLLDLAESVEANGFDSVWVGDSLYKLPRLESITLLSAIATKTRKAKLGTCCMASFPLRHPFLTACQWATLDQISSGRTVLAVCAGGPSIKGAEMGGDRFYKEWEIMHMDYKKRGQIMEEYIRIIRKLWTEENVTYAGKFYSIRDVTLEPKPFAACPPIWITNNPDFDVATPSTIERVFSRIAELADGWMTSCSLRDFQLGLTNLDKCLGARGRRREEVEIALQNGFNVNTDESKAYTDAKKFLDSFYLTDHTEEHVREGSVIGSPDRCIKELEELTNSGATTVIVRPLSSEPKKQMEIYANEILPSFI